MSQLRNLILVILLLTVGAMAGYQYGHTGRLPLNSQVVVDRFLKTNQPTSMNNADLSTFWEVWGELESDYLRTDRLDATKMIDGAIGGLTAALQDPYTMYLPPEQDKRAEEELAGSFGGVGIELGYIDNTLAVVAPLKGTPAEAAGVQAGDLILHAKDPSKNLDEDTTNWSLTEAVNHIRGENGTSVTLTLLRAEALPANPSPIPGVPTASPSSEPRRTYGQPFDVTLTRGEIVVRTVEVAFVTHQNKKAALITLSRFGERTENEWNQAVEQILKEKGVTGIILDMRNNPGGFFDGAIDVASDFIEDGVVVSQRGKTTKQDYEAIGKARLAKYPVEVLVNKGSASASEIVAGALRDQRGAKLFGEQTFGKGTVQDRRHLSNGGGLHVTIAEWLLPKGDSIQDTGIPVSVEVKNDPATEADEVVLRAVEEL